MMQVNFEYGFEKYHPNADRIYRAVIYGRNKTVVFWLSASCMKISPIILPILLIIVATVSGQSWHSATINPTKVLNSD
jgi:hypothetical protein